MKRSVFSLFLIAVTAVFTVGQGTTIVRKELAPAEIARIIKKVSENESAFREALKDYVFTRRASMSNIGLGGQVTGTYRRDSFMTFNADGGRFEKILFAPISTLTEMTVTPELISRTSAVLIPLLLNHTRSLNTILIFKALNV